MKDTNINPDFIQVIKETNHLRTIFEVKEASEDPESGLITIRLTGNKKVQVIDNL